MKTTLERFMSKVNRTECCWLWLGGKLRTGYGKFSVGGRSVQSHRFSYEQYVGEIPAGLELDHLCRVRNCVNPAHLEPVTHAENMRRGLGVGSENAAKTHCINGHPFSIENTYVRPNGARDCRKCISRRVTKYKKRRSL